MRTMRLKWSDLARSQFVDQFRFIAERNPAAAEKIRDKLRDAADRMRMHPQIGKTGRCAGTRELLAAGTPLVIVYVLAQEEIRIVAVLHTAQDYP